MKPITGSWLEFQHHNAAEGTYWNPVCFRFTEEQWRQKVREMSAFGMDHVVLLASALDGKAYFDTSLLPRQEMACGDFLEILLSEMDACGMRLFMSPGYFGDWHFPDQNMRSAEVRRREFAAMEELAARYGAHPSFYGWYFPDETGIAGHFEEEFIDYLNAYCCQVKSLNPAYKTLIAPYGTRSAACDGRYAAQLERLEVDYIAYQDEVGVRKTQVEELPGIYERLKAVHDQVGRSRLWADVEAFQFEGEVYHSPLLPAPPQRLRQQLEAVSPYVDKILIYQYQGLLNAPGTSAFCGHPDSEALYRAWEAWREEGAFKK